jgi:hypothetical protein
MRQLKILLLVTIGCIAINAPYANAHAMTEKEIVMLPPYCQAKLKNKNTQIWVDRMGFDNFIHMHHYCYGLNYMQRAQLAMDKNARRENLTQAKGEFQYVLDRWPPSFQLTQAAKAYQAKAEMMLK